MLLLAGAQVNICETIDYRNALMCHITSSDVADKKTAMLLLAAGDKPNFTWTTEEGHNVLDEIKEIEAEMSLKNISRNSVRNHLLTLNPHSNLFHRVPNLNYPVYLKEYLLYGFELTEDSVDW